jgi:putative ABC transport system ATP-binding protein
MILQVKGLQKHYQLAQEKLEILKDVNFSLEEGKSLAILGQSGSGKTTLLSLLIGLDHPSHGEIQVFGKNIAKMSEEQVTDFRAKNVGIVFQQFHLIPHLNALENVSLALEILGRPNAEEKARAMLTEVGLEHRLKHFPKELSGGECQRVAIARALVNEPKLLVADEPSGNLDVETGEHVMGLLFDLVKRKKTSLVLVTHDEELAARCDQIQHLKQGILQ